MTNESDGADKKTNPTRVALFLKIAGTVIIPILVYICLQTISRPFYTLGGKIYVGTNCLQTVFVVNPGPYSSRKPGVEFSKTAGVSIVDYSPGVSVATKDNKQAVTMDGDLGAGCSFFVTYQWVPNATIDSSPRIVCDGKQCKDSPTVDLNIIMWILVGFGLTASCVAAYAFWTYYDLSSRRKSEKDTTINNAIVALIDRCHAQEDVRDAFNSLGNFVKGKGIDIKVPPNKKENGKGKKGVE